MGDTATVLVPDHQRLFEMASEQAGYFTAEQARGCGFGWALLAYHARSGRYIRNRPGLYRLRDFPCSTGEEIMAAWLAVGRDTAVLSHESALEWLGLSDVVPATIHFTVPRSRRSRGSVPGVTLHTTSRPPTSDKVTVRNGVRMTTAVRTITDVAASGTAPEQVIAAIRQALARGLITPKGLLAAAEDQGSRVLQLIRRGLDAGVGQGP